MNRVANRLRALVEFHGDNDGDAEQLTTGEWRQLLRVMAEAVVEIERLDLLARNTGGHCGKHTHTRGGEISDRLVRI